MGAKAAAKLRRDHGGSTAVEFAIVVPLFIALIVGIIHSALLVFTIASLNYATERAARCASVSVTRCPDAASTGSFAEASYQAMGMPVFTLATDACGKSVTGTVTYDFNVVIYHTSIPLTSTACFP